MPESKLDLLLHPIRMRIVQTLGAGERLTTSRLAELLPDVPQATLYRQLQKLLQGGVLQVVETKPVRGTAEKVYALAEGAVDATPENLAELTSDEHLQQFMKFTASLVADYSEYLAQDGYDLVRDGVSFRQVHLYLTDDEYLQLLADLRSQMARYAGRAPGPGLRRRSLSTIVIPGQRPLTPKEENER